MQSGRLRNWITIQSRTLSQDALGGSVETWSALATVPANVRMVGQGERYIPSADQEVALVTHRVRMRYRDDVSPLNRIVYGTRVLDIESAVDPDGRSRELVCMCSERVGETA